VFSTSGISAVVSTPDGTIADPPFTSPVMIGKTLIVGNTPNLYGPGYLYAYDLANPSAPKLLWQRELPGIVQSMADDDTALYIGYQYGQGTDYKSFVEKVDPTTGVAVWKSSTLQTRPLFNHVPTAMAIHENMLIVNVFDHYQAFNQATGERLWVSKESMTTYCPGGGFNESALLVEAGRIYVNSEGGKCVYALNATDGNVVWARVLDKGYTFGGKPVLVRGVLYAANGYLWAFDANTGKTLSLSKYIDDYAYEIPLYYAPRDEIILWSDGVKAFRPLR